MRFCRRRRSTSAAAATAAATAATSAIALALGWTAFPAKADATQIPIFVFAGQSNMVGYATDSNQLTAGQKTVETNVLWAGRQEIPVNWAPMQAPTETSNQIFSGHGFGPELSTALTISNGSGSTKVGAVKYAVNDTGFGSDIAPDWRSDGNGQLYNTLVSRVNAALTALPTQQPGNTGTVAGMFWMQGERDSKDEDRADQYQYNVTKLIAKAREDFNNPTMQFIIGRIGLDEGPYADTIRRAQTNMARIIPGVSMINTDDLQRASGIPFASIHFSTSGTYDMGIRFGQTYLSPPVQPGATPNKAVNGGFEDYAVARWAPAAGTFLGKSFNADLMPGWVGLGAGCTLVRAGAFGAGTAAPSEGSQWLSLENGEFGSGNGGAAQTIPTVAGADYYVSFDYSARSRGNNGSFSFTYDIGGAPTTISVSTSGVAQNFMAVWQTRTFEFVAGAGSQTTLRFLPTATADDGTYFGPGIDNVQLVRRQWNAQAGDWNTPANWSGPIPNAVGAPADFLGVITAPRILTNNAAVTVGAIRFDNPNSYTISGTGSITIDVTTDSGSITVLQPAVHQINQPLRLNKNVQLDIVTGGSLGLGGAVTLAAGTTLSRTGAGGSLTFGSTVQQLGAASMQLNAGVTTFGDNVNVSTIGIGTSAVARLSGSGHLLVTGLLSPSGQLDLGRNAAVVDYTGTSPLTPLKQSITTGHITGDTSQANKRLGYAEASVLHLSSFHGQSVDSTAVLIAYTFSGDANLDDAVNVNDLALLAVNWNAAGTWSGGDFNDDGIVNQIDLGLLAGNWNASGSGSNPDLGDALASFGLPPTSVPEPIWTSTVLGAFQLLLVTVRGARGQQS